MPSSLCIHIYKSSTSISGKVVGSTSQDTVDSYFDDLHQFYRDQGLTSHIFHSKTSQSYEVCMYTE